MQRRLRWTALVLVAALGAAACGDDSGNAAGDTTTTTGDASGSGSADFELDEPLKIIGLWEIQGESSNANNALEDAAQIAIEEINSAGGVGGRQIDYKRVSTNITDPTKTIAAVREALEEGPSILIGPAGAAGSIAAAPLAEQAGVPMLALGQDDRLFNGAESGNDHVFLMAPSAAAQAEVGAQLAVEELGAEKVGIMYVNADLGTSALPSLRKGIADAGASVTEERNYAFDATDLTAQVLAMKGSDAVINWGYPNPLGVQLNQFIENGLDIPTIGAAPAAITVNSGLAKGKAIEKLYAATYCNPLDDQRPVAQTFVEKYRDRSGKDPDAVPAGAYDAIYVAVAAAEAAKSADPAALTSAMAEVTTEGVCAKAYKADSRNLLHHEISAVSFADGTPKTMKVYETE